MKKRTALLFPYGGDFWAVVEKWAAASGYRQMLSEGGGRTFQKGVGFLVAPMMLKASFEGGQARLEAWIRAGLFVRAFSLFILPAEMGVESGGFRGVLPRSMARKAVNELLLQLGQTPIP